VRFRRGGLSSPTRLVSVASTPPTDAPGNNLCSACTSAQSRSHITCGGLSLRTACDIDHTVAVENISRLHLLPHRASKWQISRQSSRQLARSSTRRVIYISSYVYLANSTPGRRDRKYATTPYAIERQSTNGPRNPQRLQPRRLCSARSPARCPRVRHQEGLPRKVAPHPSRQDQEPARARCL
jgi:hypothetical protein